MSTKFEQIRFLRRAHGVLWASNAQSGTISAKSRCSVQLKRRSESGLLKNVSLKFQTYAAKIEFKRVFIPWQSSRKDHLHRCLAGFPDYILWKDERNSIISRVGYRPSPSDRGGLQLLRLLHWRSNLHRYLFRLRFRQGLSLSRYRVDSGCRHDHLLFHLFH